MVHAEVITPDGRDIIWLRGMRLGVEFGEQDALPFQVGEVVVLDNLVEVLQLPGLSIKHPIQLCAV